MTSKIDPKSLRCLEFYYAQVEHPKAKNQKFNPFDDYSIAIHYLDPSGSSGQNYTCAGGRLDTIALIAFQCASDQKSTPGLLKKASEGLGKAIQGKIAYDNSSLFRKIKAVFCNLFGIGAIKQATLLKTYMEQIANEEADNLNRIKEQRVKNAILSNKDMLQRLEKSENQKPHSNRSPITMVIDAKGKKPDLQFPMDL